MGRRQANLLLRLAERRREEIPVTGLGAPAREADLATVDAAVGAKEQQDSQHAVGIPEDGGEDGCIFQGSGRGQTSERSRSSAVSRCRINRASPPATSTAAGRGTPL